MRILTRWVVFFLVTAGSAAWAQEPAHLFPALPPVPEPKLRTYSWGPYPVLGVLPDGKVLMAGYFSEINGVARDRLARLEADGRVDTGWVPEVTRPARSASYFETSDLVVADDGRAYFAAKLEDGLSKGIRRMRADGSLDPDWVLRAAGSTADIQLLSAGYGGGFLVSGGFTSLGGVVSAGCAFVRWDGSVDPVFAANPGGTVVESFPRRDGGWVLIVNPTDEPRTNRASFLRRVVQVQADGTPIPGVASYDVPDTGFELAPHAFAIDALGRVVFAELVRPGGSLRSTHRLARLNADGTRDPAFAPDLPQLLSLNASADVVQIATAAPIRPGQVDTLIGTDDGGLECRANFAGSAFRGMIHVSPAGVVGPSALVGDDADVFSGLARDRAGTWWGSLSNRSNPQGARLARLLPAGGGDPSFNVVMRSGASVSAVYAFSGGAVAVEGFFDEVNDLPVPGVFVMDSAGTPQVWRDTPLQSLHVLAELWDGGVLLRAPYNDPGFSLPEALAVRVLPDGRSQVLKIPTSTWQTGPGYQLTIQSGWLDAQGGVVLSVMGRLFHFSPEGVYEPDRTTNSVGFESVGPTGVVWAVSSPTGTSFEVRRLDETGRTLFSTKFQATRASGGAGEIRSIAAVADGVLVGGSFDSINNVSISGIARLDNFGSVDPDWGGWLLGPSTVVRKIRAGANGLIQVSGQLRTPLGDREVLLLRADGLLEPNAVYVGPSLLNADYHAWLAPDGETLASLKVANTTRLSANLDRRSVTKVEGLALEGPPWNGDPGATIELRVRWTGVPVSIEWLRNGVVIPDATGWALSIQPTRADDGAIYMARLTLEGGGFLYTGPWRLRVAEPSARVVNAAIRGYAGVGDSTLIMGFVVDGDAQAPLFVRGLGSVLGELGVPHPARAVIAPLLGADAVPVPPLADYAFFDRWGLVHRDILAVGRQVGCFRPELGWRDGVDQMLHPGQASGIYQMHLTVRDAADSGVALGEVFLAPNRPRGTRLLNFAGRGRIGSSGEELIAGFTITGDRPLRVLVRAVGPGLAGFGVAGVVDDPRLSVHRAQDVVGGNEDWSADPAARAAIIEASHRVGAFPLTDGSRDAALIMELEPAEYTAVAHARDNSGGGVALVELFVVE